MIWSFEVLFERMQARTSAEPFRLQDSTETRPQCNWPRFPRSPSLRAKPSWPGAIVSLSSARWEIDLKIGNICKLLSRYLKKGITYFMTLRKKIMRWKIFSIQIHFFSLQFIFTSFHRNPVIFISMSNARFIRFRWLKDSHSPQFTSCATAESFWSRVTSTSTSTEAEWP